MLQQMRTNMKVIWFLAIIFPFGFVYLLSGRHASNSGNQREVNTVAVVNGTKIPYEMYNRYVTQLVESQRRQMNGRDLPSQQYDQLESEAWDEVLSAELLSQEARRLGVQVPDDEIVGMITQSPPGFIQQRFTNEKGEFDEKRVLTLVDEFTRECLAIDVAGSIRSKRVIEVLARLISARGAPCSFWRESERPKPSVPSTRYSRPRGMKGRIWSANAFT